MADIGTTLREARMRARIDINEVERRTKIRAKYLRAIENEEWDLLPGPIYAKSFLRTYGDFLGLDSRLLVDEFRRRYERPSEHDLRPLTPLHRERERARRRPRVPPWAIVGLVLAAVVVALGVIGSRGRSHPAAAPTAAMPRTTTVTTHHTVTRPAAPPRPREVTLRIVPTGTVYVCLVDGKGNKLINERTFAAGQAVPTERASKLLLTLGNNAVNLRVNGKPLAVAPSPSAIRLLLGPTSSRPIALSAHPTCP